MSKRGALPAAGLPPLAPTLLALGAPRDRCAFSAEMMNGGGDRRRRIMASDAQELESEGTQACVAVGGGLAGEDAEEMLCYDELPAL